MGKAKASGKGTRKRNAGQFKPGQSGNPGGRPKGLTEFRLAAREHSEEALRRLVGIMRARKPDPLASSRVRAIRELFDRAWGKPVQELQVQGSMASVHLDAKGNMTREEQIDVGRRMAFLLENAAHAENRPEQKRQVRKRVNLHEEGARGQRR